MASNASQLKAVLFDRDGTLVIDVPYNGDPEKVTPFPGARKVLDELRGLGLATGVLSNQSGVARGILTLDQVNSVNNRVEELLGPFDVWEVCPHSAEDSCTCRKPAPGMIHSACIRLGIETREAAFIGDIGSDVEAARAAGARGVLVPTPVTREEEVSAAPEVAADLEQAVALLLKGPA
jgi:D-glycero-D-manno-heptose 1,7-bisphosphate phosphatase